MKNTLKYLCLMLMLSISYEAAYSQSNKVLSGTVFEMVNEKKLPFIGVNIMLTNNQNRVLSGVTTNVSGEYVLIIPLNTSGLKIVYSFIGMTAQTVPYKGQTKQDITLLEDTKQLSEIIITSEKIQQSELGVTMREQTAATQRISMEQILDAVPVGSIEEALQGRLAGVDIIAGGDPGAKSSIRIRGTATLTTSADPLIVVNGVPYSTDIAGDFNFATANNDDYAEMLNISPHDIETIEVLKDAASTAMYGTSGANGVLLITTKKGSKGKTRFSLSTKFSAKFEPNPIPMLSGDEYVSFIQDAIWNSANAVGVSNSKALLELLYNTPEINHNSDWRYFNEYNTNTDWLSHIRKNALTTDNNFSMSGGGEKATYRFSVSYLNEGGTTIGTNLERLTSSLNVGYNFSSKLRIDAEFTYSETDMQNNWTDKVRSEAMLKMPNKSPYYIDKKTLQQTNKYFTRQNSEDFQGAFNGSSRNFHPIIMANDSYDDSNQQEEKVNFRLNYDILQGLTYTGYVSMKFKTVKTNKFLPAIATGVTMDSPFSNQATDAYSDNLALQTENKLIFRKRFNDNHNLVATGIWRTSSSESSNYLNTTFGNPTAGISDASSGGTIHEKASGTSEVRSLSGIASVNYTFLNRYVFNAIVNYEGKSSLGKSNRWGLFPSFGVAWHAQEESFLRDLEWLEQCKVRLSYGESGAAPSGTAPYMGTYSALGQYNDNAVIAPVTIQLNNLKWQTSREADLGIDLGFLNNRLTMTFDYYYKYTSDLLQKKVSVPSTLGYISNQIAYFNSGELSNAGWEYRIDYEIYTNKDWRISANFNVNRNINQIEKLPSNMNEVSYSLKNGAYAQKFVSGTPVGSFFGYKYLGVFQNKENTYARDNKGNIMQNLDGNPIVMRNGSYTCFPGDAKYQDMNHDGVINEQDIVYLGNSMPLLTGGGGITAKYKSVTLTAFFHYRLGQKIINTARMNSESMYGTDNQSTAVLRRWRNEGDNTNIPRALWAYGYNYLGSDRFVEDCSYLRLKTLSFGYNLPKKWCNSILTNSINVFITGYDLFTWTKYTGQDPEVSLPSGIGDLAKDEAQTPRSTRLACGLSINF